MIVYILKFYTNNYFLKKNLYDHFETHKYLLRRCVCSATRHGGPTDARYDRDADTDSARPRPAQASPSPVAQAAPAGPSGASRLGAGTIALSPADTGLTGQPVALPAGRRAIHERDLDPCLGHLSVRLFLFHTDKKSALKWSPKPQVRASVCRSHYPLAQIQALLASHKIGLPRDASVPLIASTSTPLLLCSSSTRG